MAQDGTTHRREHKGKYFILEELGGETSIFSCLLHAQERLCRFGGMRPDEPNAALASAAPEL